MDTCRRKLFACFSGEMAGHATPISHVFANFQLNGIGVTT
jgi:hypothetical protein